MKYLFPFIITSVAMVANGAFQRNDSIISSDSIKYVLNDTVITLDEVVIKEQKKIIKWNGNEMLIDVAGTDLKNETNITDLLKRIPGIRIIGDKIEIPGHKNPVYYINDRKVMNFYEVEMLPIKDIQSMRLLLSPGVEYDSDGAPVIVIKTKRKVDGITIQASPTLYYGRKWFHNENLNVDLHTKNIDIFGMYRYNDSYSYSESESLTEVKSDTLWRQAQTSIDDVRSRAHTFQMGVNYNRSKYSLGIKYDGTYNNINQIKDEQTDLQNTYQEGTLMFVKTDKFIGANSANHHANIYFWLALSKYWKLKMNGDYIHKQYLGNNAIKNDISKARDSLAYDIKSVWNVFAFQLSLNYNNKKYGNFAIGANSSTVNGFSETEYSNGIYQNGKTKLDEKRYSLFMSYYYNWKQWTIRTGLRYDWHSTESKNVYTGSSLEEHYPDWQPSIALSYNSALLNQFVSYSMSVTRPQYSDLNANLYYVNPFVYVKGNIDLKPAKEHAIRYVLYWKYLYANIGYAYIKNMLILQSDVASEKSYATVNYTENIGQTHILTSTLNFKYPIKFWEPSVNLFVHKTFYEYSHFGGLMRSKTPVFILNWNNIFKLSPTFRLSLDFQQGFRGDMYNMTSYPQSVINVQLQKTFLKDQLQLVLGGTDLFRGDKLQGSARYNALNLEINTKRNSQRIYFRIIYRFNHSLSKNKYKGENAADEELNRLDRNAGE